MPRDSASLRWLTRTARRHRRSLIASAAALAIIATLAATLLPGTRPQPDPATVGPLPLQYADESSGSVSIGRDCGFSVPLPANPRRSLWLFCDTPVYARQRDGRHSSWKLLAFVPGSSAAAGGAVAGPGGIVPGVLSEAGTPLVTGFAPLPVASPAPQGRLGQFLPAPAGLFTSGGLPCGFGGGSYAASWISGAAAVPGTPDLLISYNNYCVSSGSGTFQDEGFGLEEYDPADRVLSDDATVFTGPPGGFGTTPVPLGSPVFNGGYLYLFGPTCAGAGNGRCSGTMIEARVAASPQAWSSPLSYQWHTTGPFGSWTSDPAAATALVPGTGPAGEQDVADFTAAGHGLVMIEQTDIKGGFSVYQAPGPAGPWTQIRSGRVACRGQGTGYANFCRAITAHPELSTQSELVLSYFDPGQGPGGHVMIQGFRWRTAPGRGPGAAGAAPGPG